MLHPMPAQSIKRKRDSVDGAESHERSTSRMNPPQYNMSNSSGDAFGENFFNLDQLAAASSAQSEQVRIGAEAQEAERISANSANNAFASPVPMAQMAQMEGYVSAPSVQREDHGSANVVHASNTANPEDDYEETNDGQVEDPSHSPGGKGNKPIVGTDEWHKQRKMSHKEGTDSPHPANFYNECAPKLTILPIVERRRRSNINDAITAIAGLLPRAQPNQSSSSYNPSNSSRTRTPASAAPIPATSEKNKGAILAAAVSYIRTLRDEKTSSLEKWTFEKMVTDEAIRTLEGRLERMAKVGERWKMIAKEAGVDVEDVEVAMRVYQGIGPSEENVKDKGDGAGIGHTGERGVSMVREDMREEGV